MTDGSLLARRVDDALGANSLQAIGPLLVRALRTRLTPSRARSAALHSGFDHTFGVNTSGIAPLSSLLIESKNRRAGVRYEPTAPEAFAKMAALLPEDAIRKCTFIDVGCGRGRVLMLAAEYGFRKVIGIEFAQDLCKAAGENVALYRSRKPADVNISIEHGDACSFIFDDEPSVLFLYNPFNAAVMQSFVENVEYSLARSPRDLYIIYSLPFWKEVWDMSPMFSRIAGTSIWSEDWYAVYKGV